MDPLPAPLRHCRLRRWTCHAVPCHWEGDEEKRRASEGKQRLEGNAGTEEDGDKMASCPHFRQFGRPRRQVSPAPEPEMSPCQSRDLPTTWGRHPPAGVKSRKKSLIYELQLAKQLLRVYMGQRVLLPYLGQTLAKLRSKNVQE